MEKGANTYRMIRIGEGRFLVFPLFPSDFDPRVVPPQGQQTGVLKHRESKTEQRCGKGLEGVKRAWKKSQRGESWGKGSLYSATSPRLTPKLSVHKINPKHIAEALASKAQLVGRHPVTMCHRGTSLE